MQSEVYEYFLNNHKDILICEDDKEAFKCSQATKFAGYESFILPDFRAVKGDDLRSFYGELIGISKELNSFYKSKVKKKVIITPIKTILNPLPAKSHLKSIFINFGERIEQNEFKDEISRLGYEVVDIVQMQGEISFRGEIIDVFPINSDEPFRILLDIDEVESIRKFDLITQISDKFELESLEISPFIANLNKDEFDKMSQKIKSLQNNSLIDDMNSLGFWAIDSFINYLENFSFISIKDFKESELESLNIPKNLEVLPKAKIYKDLDITFSNELLEFHKEKHIKILASSQAIFESFDLKNSDNVELIKSDLILNLISKDEIIISLNKKASKKRTRKASIVIDELKIGDFVVHENHGIGKFAGLEKVTVMGATKEFVSILYQNDDKLLLPVENLNLIDRYIADSGAAILDKLGKGSFAKIKERVRVKLFEIASKIIALAAKRELIKGKVISLNNPLILQEYSEFTSKAGFVYTKDQQSAIDSIIKDFQSGKVMDRLISGDVGFGKTEVAMNASFLTIKNGFQVLFFVPTTLLSSQHYQTLKERFNGFNIDVYKCDRFTSTASKNALKKALNDGKPLICIGTHALLNLKASNLGLIIIDEEHKFGVKQKEKLKELSNNSHLLSMSATPIPRSLNMALSSIKSYSTLLTPPDDRLDVRTIVKEFDEKIIKEAILRELRRGGQIFYVHNHIASINKVKNELLEILPNLKILVLHSKIEQKTTENEIEKFINKEYDLMLCTSIVESGIHMPNANTMIVNNANKFGMADLHQLRGRVGRSSIQGYCYFLIEDKNALSKDSLKRLVALESNSFLGSGSVLAYHDLEIRGGGNLVGEAQSGHIEAIGYSLYLRMLEDEINALLNKKSNTLTNVDIKLSINAFLNSEFIKEDRLRLDLYKRLSKAQDESEIYDIKAEVEDRFGKIDKFSKQFFWLMIIKILAIKHGFKQISNYEMNITLTKLDDSKVVIKSNSKDDDDILEAILIYLRKLDKTK
ncbi:transcription-repair coupling factor [Campylobacter ureolyticus]|uniref:transcription-repair coupling factor n=1 Tax=Campylobacter ureolyticus TaxID=827 RepID=UPI00215AB50E|nr:transcription-repair coupling factor [Campylobacter ureolyticus]MCR8699329.1 transcription-repair coupling factor [Campylobacter ureolyticus]